MHACIENSKKGKSIYVPEQWVTLVRCSKDNGNPYVVIKIAIEEFLDLKQKVEDKSNNWKPSVDGCLIKWNQIIEVMVPYEKPFILHIKYNLMSSDFIKMDIKIKKKKGRHQTRINPTQAYSKKLPIEKAKLEDLL